tara:strand:+ start:2277 stop:3725 length:1449 start_codon:yes stop_codon:yes gene_type:complete
MNAKHFALYLPLLSSLVACSGGSDPKEDPEPELNGNEKLLFIDQPSISSSMRNLYSVDPENTTSQTTPVNDAQFSQYAIHPALPLSTDSFAHSVIWIEGDTLWGFDSFANSRYQLAKSNTIQNTCSISFKAAMNDGSQNFILLRDKGIDGSCSDDDSYYRINYSRSSSSNLNLLSETSVQGLTGGLIVSNITPETYSTFLDSDNKLAIFNQASSEVTARYDISQNINWGPSIDETIYAVVNSELYEIPFNELVSGTYSFANGISIGSGDYNFKLVNTSLYISTADTFYLYNATNNSISEIADLSFSSTGIITVTDSYAYIINRDNGEAYIYACNLTTGSLSEVMRSSDPMFSVFPLEEKLWASDSSDAFIYTIDSNETSTIEQAKFSFVTWSDLIDIALIKKPGFDGSNATEGFIAKYNASTSSEMTNYGTYLGTPLSLGWHGNKYRLAVDSDFYKVHLVDFSSGNSLTEIFVSNGRVTLPF